MGSYRTAQIIGMLVFAIGLGLLLLVFFDARADLNKPLTGTTSLQAMVLAQRVGLLFIMGYVASSIAGRGAQMFTAGSVGETSVHKDPQTISPSEE